MQLPSPAVTGWLEEKRKPRDLTRALPMEIGSESEQGGSAERENLAGSDGKDSEGLREGERLPCLGEEEAVVKLQPIALMASYPLRIA